MSTKVKSIITNMVIIILILSNVYLITRPQKLDYEIIIGSPTKIEEENVVGIDYTKSKPIKKKSEYETILFP